MFSVMYRNLLEDLAMSGADGFNNSELGYNDQNQTNFSFYSIGLGISRQLNMIAML